MCAALDVSPAGFYKRLRKERDPSDRGREDAMLKKEIRQVHEGSKKTYGRPRLHLALQSKGYECGKHRLVRLMKEEGSATRRGKLQGGRDAGTALRRLINNVLDFSKLAAGELSIARASLDLDELVADLLETTRPLAENKGLLIQSHVQDNVPRSLVGDQVRVRQILANLSDNAVKCT